MEGYENDESRILEDLVTEKKIPPGNPISGKCSLGDILQSWNFLWCFHDVLGLKKGFSLEEIATEFTETSSKGLNEVHILIMQVLLSDLQIKSQSQDSTKKVAGCLTEMWNKIDLSILNELTWPELTRRYVLALVSTGGDFDSAKAHEDIDVFHCLHGDGGRLCGSLTGIAGLEADTWLLAIAANKIYGSLNNNDDMLAIDDMDFEIGSASQNIVVNEENPDWVRELEPVKDLDTNVGSRIKKCIENSIRKCPPTWAIDALKISISKEIYIANSSGHTKNIALNVVRQFHIMQSTIAVCRKRRKFISISDVVLKQCRIILRRTAIAFCKFGRKKIAGYGDEGSPYLIPRPLDFRAIDMRLATGAYCGSHQAFLEDVQELWRNLPIGFHKLVEDFELSYNKEVVAFQQKLVNQNKLELLSTDLRKDVENVLYSATEISKAPWEGLCKVCGIDENDNRVLLCDTEKCNGEYHTYCLSPPLAKVPQEKWYCPRCVPKNDIPHYASPNASSLVYQKQKKKKKQSMNPILNEIASLAATMQEREYWDLSLHERTHLLKFFCDEMLSSSQMRKYIKDNNKNKSSESLLWSEFLGFDSVGRLYWILESGSSPWIIIGKTNKVHEQCSTSQVSYISQTICPQIFEEICCATTSTELSWFCYQSDSEINSLMDFLNDEIVIKEKLDLFLRRYKLRSRGLDNSKGQNIRELQPSFVRKDIASFGLDNLMTRATKILESKYGSFVKIDTILSEQQRNKGKMRINEQMYRCHCLEPILPRGLHCLCCHKTCISNMEFQYHGKGICNIKVPMPLEIKEITDTFQSQELHVVVDEFFKGMVEQEDETLLSLEANVGLEFSKSFKVPVSSQRQLTDKACDISKHIKATLLDIEVALPQDAVRSSKTCNDKRQAWRAFIKSARTIYEMVQAIIVLEGMIKSEYVDITMRKYWSSISAAGSISTLAALSLRVYSLDAVIDYKEKWQENLGSSGKTQGKMNKKRKEQVIP